MEKSPNCSGKGADRFSVCVHGCDHTNEEFAAGDERVLKYKTRLSDRRMDSHEGSTGIPYKKVMTFPQGRYSSASLRILKSGNYLGAFHSSSRPVDMTDHRYRIRDYLDLCVMCYENFPLFLRRYPGNDVDTKIDVFLGKNLFFVHHHDFFRNGYDRTVSIMQKMNRDHGRIVWAGLDEILANVYLSRTDSRGETSLPDLHERCSDKKRLRDGKKIRRHQGRNAERADTMRVGGRGRNGVRHRRER